MSLLRKLGIRSSKRASRDRLQGVVRVGGWWNPPRYALGYIQAARAVFEKSVAADAETRRQMALPCVFLLRHAVELALKQLIVGVNDIEEDKRQYQEAMGEAVTAVAVPAKDLKRVGRTHDLSELLSILDRNLAATRRGPVPPSWGALVLQLGRLEDDAVDRFRYGEVRWRRSKRGKSRGSDRFKRSFPREKRIPLRQLVERADKMVHEAVDLDEEGPWASMFLHWNFEAHGYIETLHLNDHL